MKTTKTTKVRFEVSDETFAAINEIVATTGASREKVINDLVRKGAEILEKMDSPPRQE